MEPEVMKAIPRSSVIKRIVIYVGIGLLLSWGGKSFLRPAITTYLSVASHEEFLSRLQVLAIGLGIFELSIAVYLAVIATRESFGRGNLHIQVLRCGETRGLCVAKRLWFEGVVPQLGRFAYWGSRSIWHTFRIGWR